MAHAPQRNAAFSTFTKRQMKDFLDERGVMLLSGGLDECPLAYKDIETVMAVQSDLVETLVRFYP